MRDTTPDDYVNIFMGLRERSGGFDWVSEQDESADKAVVRMTRKLSGETNTLTVTLEEAAPHRIARLDLRPTPGAVARVASDAELASTLQHFVSALARVDAFSSSVLLAKDGKKAVVRRPAFRSSCLTTRMLPPRRR